MTEREEIRRELQEEQMAALHAKYAGFKPLMIWYSLLTVGFTVVAILAFQPFGAVTGLVCLGLAVASGFYASYLFKGGLHRVWFFIF